MGNQNKMWRHAPNDVPVMDKGRQPSHTYAAVGLSFSHDPLGKSSSLSRTDRDRKPGRPVPVEIARHDAAFNVKPSRCVEPINVAPLAVSIQTLIERRQWQTISAIEGRSIDAVRCQYDRGYLRDTAEVLESAKDRLAAKCADWATETRRRCHSMFIKPQELSVMAGREPLTLRQYLNGTVKPSQALMDDVNRVLDHLEKTMVAK